MAGKVLNIEIDDRLTKVCLSQPKGKSIQIKKSFLFQTPENTVSDGVISDPKSLAETLGKELQSHGLTGTKNAIFTLTSGKVATREVTLPPVKDNKLKSIVEANATEYFPVDLSRYHITYSLLERITAGDEPGCRVLVLAVPLAVLEGYFKLAELAGLSLQAIDYFGNSQYQALKSVTGKDVCMYVNVDCSHSLVTFMKGTKFLMQRSFNFGGDELILNYMIAAELKADGYVSALKACSTPDHQFLKNGVMTQSAVEDSLGRLVSSIVRSIDYFNSGHWEMQVGGIVLMGACSHIAGLREMVASGAGLPTTYLDDSPMISTLTNAAQSVSCFISCIGSNLSPLDFMPSQFKVDKKKHKGKEAGQKTGSLVPSVLVCAGCLVVAVGLGILGYSHYQKALSDNTAANDEIASLSYTRDIYNTYTTYQDSVDALDSFKTSIDTPNDSLTAFIEELEQKMPSQILVLSASCTSDGVTMNVTLPNFDAVAVVLVELRTFESISDVTVSSIVEQTDSSGATYVSLTVQCTYGANPYLGETDPYASPSPSPSASTASTASPTPEG